MSETPEDRGGVEAWIGRYSPSSLSQRAPDTWQRLYFEEVGRWVYQAFGLTWRDHFKAPVVSEELDLRIEAPSGVIDWFDVYLKTEDTLSPKRVREEVLRSLNQMNQLNTDFDSSVLKFESEVARLAGMSLAYLASLPDSQTETPRDAAGFVSSAAGDEKTRRDRSDTGMEVNTTRQVSVEISLVGTHHTLSGSVDSEMSCRLMLHFENPDHDVEVQLFSGTTKRKNELVISAMTPLSIGVQA